MRYAGQELLPRFSSHLHFSQAIRWVTVGSHSRDPQFDSVSRVEVHNAKLDAMEAGNSRAESSSYLGSPAFMLVNRAGIPAAGTPANGETIAILKGSDFSDGTRCGCAAVDRRPSVCLPQGNAFVF